MSDPGKAVFLSYASQDAEAAKRICEALRAAGVEVWFDQNELVGGDAWDQKIRRQIKECALLVPIISASTQSRTEGYFRLEWRLADQRTHLMAKGRPFLLPVVIDDTRDDQAHVPDSFTEVQWTRLRPSGFGAASPMGGEDLALGKFVARVQQLLLSKEQGARGMEQESGGAALRRDSADSSGRKAPPTGKPTRRWLVPVIGGLGLTLVALVIWRTGEKPPAAVPAQPALATPVTPADVPMTEARNLVAQARALLDDDLMTGRENFRLAQDLAKKATVMDPADGEAWATLARVLVGTWGRNYESSLSLREQARSAVDRATRLAPKSVETGLAASVYQGLSGQVVEAERIARETVARFPNDQRGLRLLAEICFAANKAGEALELLHRSATLNGGDVRALTEEAAYLRGQKRWREAEALVDQSLAQAGSSAGYHAKLLLVLDLDEIERGRAVIAQIPAQLLQEDVFASLIARYWLFVGEPAKALEILGLVPRDFFEEARQYVPKGWVTGWALQMSGRPVAAKSEWTQALAVVEKRLQAEPNRRNLVLYRSRLLALLGRRAEAEAAVQLAGELNGADKVGSAISAANVNVCAGDNEGAITLILAAMSDREELFGRGFWYGLKRDPMYAPIRSDPRIQELITWGDERLRQLKAGGPGKTTGL